jgi:tetratricopeptide (TPR) repeat protein
MAPVNVANAAGIVNSFAAGGHPFRIITHLKYLCVATPAILLLSIAVLSITLIEDPDAWTHLALGRDIVQRGGLPTHETLSFPSAGSQPYYNPEWLFGVLLYLAHAISGIAGVVVLKTLIVAVAFSILWRDSRDEGDDRPQTPRHLLVRFAVLLGAVLVVRHRFVERPDIMLMAVLAFTIYALNAYLAAGRRYLYALPLVQVVWANTHPSAIVGIVPFAAVLGGGLVLRLWETWRPRSVPAAPSWRQLATVTGTLAAIVAAAALNPYTWDALLLPFRIATDLPWFRQEVFELQPPRLATSPAPFVIVALLAVTFAAYGVVTRRLPIIAIALVLPFINLGLTAIRFVFLLAIVAAPMLARHLNAIADRCPGAWASRVWQAGASAAATVAAAAVVLAVLQVHPFGDARKVIGAGVNTRYVPEAALAYLDRNRIEGRLFNAFHWGGYIAWRDFPRRSAIIDGRGNVTPELLEEIHFARVYPHHLDRLQAAYGIDAAVVDYPSYSGDRVEDVIGPDADAGLASPAWALVYWDDVALVYLRRGGRHAAVIARDEYRHVRPANGAAGIARARNDPRRVSGVLADLERNVRETGSSTAWLLAGYMAQRPEQAVAAFGLVRDHARLFEAYQGQAAAYVQQKDFQSALAAYEQALRQQEAAPVLYNAALACIQAGDDRRAITYLERARGVDPMLTPVYPVLVAAYRRMGDEPSAQALGPDFLAAATRTRVADHVAAAHRLRSAGQRQQADAELEAALKLDPRNAPALTAVGFGRLYENRVDEASRALQAAVDADGGLAAPRFYLAQIARARGDLASMRVHLTHFIRLSPRSYEAWRARQELAKVPRS